VDRCGVHRQGNGLAVSLLHAAKRMSKTLLSRKAHVPLDVHLDVHLDVYLDVLYLDVFLDVPREKLALALLSHVFPP
jgi:hypothetical protein